MSTSDLAFRVGLTEGAIRQLESGRTKSPSFSIGLKLSAVLDVDPWELSVGPQQPGARAGGSLKDRVARLEARMDAVERVAGVSERVRRPAGRR
jgi:transcriptional regulator with XRE-family HTH domain